VKRPTSQWIVDSLFCLFGFLLGYISFSLLNLWLYGDFSLTLGVGLPLHLLVTLIYTALLVFARRRWEHFISHTALFLCGIAMGFFPVLGLFPVYFFRLRIAAYLVSIHIIALAAILIVTFSFAFLVGLLIGFRKTSFKTCNKPRRSFLPPSATQRPWLTASNSFRKNWPQLLVNKPIARCFC
jgi:hypothetical protein